MIIFIYGKILPLLQFIPLNHQDSVHNADQPQPGNDQPTPTPLGMPYTPNPPAQPGYINPAPVTPPMSFTPYIPPPLGRRSSDDWIHQRLQTPGAGSPGLAGFSPNWLMNTPR
jgi:hypothetical protein